VTHLPNHKSYLDQQTQADAQLELNIQAGIIELQQHILPHTDPFTPHPSFVTTINPLGCTHKHNSTEVRPYLDPTITGVNLAMTPLPLHLPTIEGVLPLLSKGHYLAKRDWRHGFHHATLDIPSRKFMGIRLSDGRVARFVALPFGASQSPALFSEIANEFARLLHFTLTLHHLHDVILCVYIDDILISTPTHHQMTQTCTIMDELAEDLGIEFKTTKDLGISTALQEIEFLGIQLSTYPTIQAYPSPNKIATITARLHDLLPQHTLPYRKLESLLGKLAFLGQCHSLLKLALRPLYEILQYHSPTP
jgi:hypothetical protein